MSRILPEGDDLTLDHIKANCEVAENGCWIWQRARHNFGYGVVWHNRKLRYAHALAYVLSGAPVQEDGEILHSCDNPPCCNPLHLSAGSHSDNMSDMAKKGRSGTRKLTKSDVMRILANSAPSRWLAKKYGVNKSTILRVKSGRTWKHVT